MWIGPFIWLVKSTDVPLKKKMIKKTLFLSWAVFLAQVPGGRALRLPYTFRGVFRGVTRPSGCNASGLNCRYIHPDIKLKLIELGIKLNQEF